MSELISGKEALIALANGEDVEFKTQCRFDGDVMPNEWRKTSMDWHGGDMLSLHNFNNDARFEFRLKPRTITINGIELAHCYAVGIDHIKNEVSIQLHNNEDAVKLNNLLLNIYGFRNA